MSSVLFRERRVVKADLPPGGDDIVVQGNFPCQFCGISFQQQHVSDKHKAEIHERLFTCEDASCSASFNDQVNLKLHVRLNHFQPTTKPFQCQKCDKQYQLQT